MNPALIAVCFFSLGVLVRDVAQDWRDQAALVVGVPVHTQEQARIWSAKCLRAGKRPLVMQADRNPIVIRCTSAKELSV